MRREDSIREAGSAWLSLAKMLEMTFQRREGFYSELAKLTEAGFGIREALRLMVESGLQEAESNRVERMESALAEGRSIAGAFAAAEVSKLEAVLIEAGERSGKIATAYRHLAEYFGMLAAARRKALQALVYPLVLLHLGMLLAAIPVGDLMEGLDFTRVVVRLGISLALAYGGIGLGYLWVRSALAKAPTDAGVDRALNRIPWVGKARRSLAMARYARVDHAAVLAGLPMEETVRLAGEASLSGELTAAVERIVPAVKEGMAIGPLMVGEPAFPKSFSRSYLTAEESGTLDQDLDRWAKHFANEASERVDRLTVMLPKLGYALIVAFVVWKILGFYSGYFGLIEELGG
nr:type II secretion system F family protein [Haloferula luteola]